jgi:hypothetical protein
MSQGVYLSKDAAHPTRAEETALRIRRPVRAATVKAWHPRLPQASQPEDGRWVRRLTGLLARLEPQGPMAGWGERWGRRPSGRDDGPQAWRWRGLDRLGDPHGGGRPAPWTPRQHTRVVALRAAGPLVGGGETAGGHAVLLRVRSWRACGVLSQRPEGSPWLHPLGCAWPKARWVADPRAPAPRRAGRPAPWPALGRAAPRRGGLLLVADAARLAPGGARRSPWARRGPPPAGPPRGTRQGDPVFGALASGAGRLGSQGLAGRCHSAQSPACGRMILAQTPAHRWGIPDGARWPTSASPQAVGAAPWPS